MARTPKDENDQSVKFEETQPGKSEDTPSQSQTAAAPEPESPPQAQEQGVVEAKVVIGNQEYTLNQVQDKTIEKLKNEEKRVVVIPRIGGPGKQLPLDIGINGVVFRLPRGVKVLVPMSVDLNLLNSYDSETELEKKQKELEEKANQL